MFDEAELNKYFLYSYYDEMGKDVGVFSKDIDEITKAIAERKYDIVEFE